MSCGCCEKALFPFLNCIGQGHCRTPGASLCQAVENFALALTCSLCDDQDEVQWSFSNSSEEGFLLAEQNKTLILAAVNVTNDKASGCYLCQCGRESKYMDFTVQVDFPGKHPMGEKNGRAVNMHHLFWRTPN